MAWQERIIEQLKRMKMNYLKQERGSILVLSVILLPILFAFLGFGYDFGNIYMHKSRLQNVADAAALAGARAYLDSQATDNKDAVDGTVDRANGKLTANSTATYPEGRNTPDVYNVGDAQKSKNRDYSKHKAADKAADAYIYHNIINLGSEVKTDKWSHYAVNSDNANPKTFYRVGLYEEVPLYFLPIIKSVKSPQIVRAGAIALVVPGSSTGNPGGGSTTTARTILDNLYTFSNSIALPSKTENYDFNGAAQLTNKVNSTYEGAIVYTDSNAQFNEVHETEIFKKVFYGSGALGVNERLAELFDEFGYYAELNSAFAIDSDVYINAFSKVFEAPHTVFTLENGEMNSASIRAKNSTYFVKNEINNGDLNINAAIGNESDSPLFLKYPTNHEVMHINVSADNVRPIIVVYLGTNEIDIQGNGTFRGTVYAPYGTVSCPSDNFTFYGNIIAKNLYLRGKNQKYYQVNYLKDADGFNNVLPTVSSSVRKITQTEYNTIYNNSVAYYSSDSSLGNHSNNYGVSANLFDWIIANGTNAEAFAALPDDGGGDSELTKKNIIKAWMVTYERVVNELKNKYGDFQLASLNKVNKFMWDSYDPSTQTDENGDENETQTASTLRLINFRTDYQDSSQENAVVDPFIFLSLDEQNAY